MRLYALENEQTGGCYIGFMQRRKTSKSKGATRTLLMWRPLIFVFERFDVSSQGSVCSAWSKCHATERPPPGANGTRLNRLTLDQVTCYQMASLYVS